MHTLPILLINLNGEMLYILEQRLRAQTIAPAKIKKGTTQYNTRNKSNVYFESLQYWQDVFPIAHYHNRKTSLPENHNNTCAENRKINGLKFDTL